MLFPAFFQILVIGMIGSPQSTTRYLFLTEFEVCTGRTEFFSPLFDLWLKHKSSLLVLNSAPRGFSLGTPVSPSLIYSLPN